MLAFVAPLLAALSLQAALDARAAAAPGTGIAVGIIDHGVTRVYVAGSAGNGRAVDAHTLFEIGSVTKTFTATTLAAMVLRKEVDLSDPISEFLPAGIHAPTKDGKAITLLDLAEQRSGLPRLPSNMDDVAGDDPYADYTVADMYAFLNDFALNRDPGAKYEYSNYGVGLLGQLLANRAKVPYPTLVRDTVLNPLGMNDTTFAVWPAQDPATLAVGHEIGGGDAVATWHFQSILPAGGIISSVSDMLKYLRCNMGMGPLARTCLFAQQPRNQGMTGHEIGLVWNINSSTGVIGHDGDTLGFHADVAVSRDRKVGVVVLSNGPGVTDIAGHVLLPRYPIAVCPASVPAAKTDPASYSGIYCNASTAMTFTVAGTARPDQLAIALLPQPTLVYSRIATDTFYAAVVGATFKFLRSGDAIVGLRVLQAGVVVPAVRLDAAGKPVAVQLPPEFPPEVSLDAAALAQYVGSYAIDDGTFTVTLRGDTLYVQLAGQPAAPVYASAKDHFFYKAVDAQISFERNAAGAVTGLTLNQNGQALHATRTGSAASP
jgi:CubicO group peptidase (beta-lactamase class C family)